MFNAFGEILQKLIAIYPTDYKFVSLSTFSCTDNSEGACGKLGTKFALRGNREVLVARETLWIGNLFHFLISGLFGAFFAFS